MKNLFKLIIACLFLYSCASTTYKEEDMKMDSIYAAEMLDSSYVSSLNETIQVESLSEDTTKRKTFLASKLDTTTVLRDLKKNLKVIDSQQKELDSLLREKGKK